MLYSRLKRVGTAELRIDDNEADGPVDDDGKTNQKNGACQEAGVPERIGLTNNARAAALVSIPRRRTMPCLLHDAVCHVHERVAHVTPRLRGFEMFLGVEFSRHCDTWCFDACKQRQSLHSFSAIAAMCVHVVLPL